MAISKVCFGGSPLIDLTGDTVAADKLLSGYTAHDKSGALITGTYVDGSASDNYVKSGLVFIDQNLSGQASGCLEISPGIAYPQDEVTAEICYRADNMAANYTRVFETAGITFGLSKVPSDVGQNSDYAYNPFFTQEPNGDEIKLPVNDLAFGDVHTFTVKRVRGLATGYLDGVMMGTFSSSVTSFSSPNVYFMCGSFSGRVTEGTWFCARIYRRAMSDAEILQNYTEDVIRYGS